MALWCNWLTYCPVTAESTSSILVRVVKEVYLIKSKVNLDYNYSIPKMQDIIEHTVSYNWNAEKHMEKVLPELHSIKDKEI